MLIRLSHLDYLFQPSDLESHTARSHAPSNSVHVGEDEVEQNDVRRMLGKQAQRRLAVPCKVEGVVVRKDGLKLREDRWLVVHDQTDRPRRV